MGNGILGMWGTWKMFTRIPGYLFQDLGECCYVNIPVNVEKDSGECSRRIWGMFKRIPGNF